MIILLFGLMMMKKIKFCDNHATFKLSASGEARYLSDSNFNLVDGFTFGEQQTDMGFYLESQMARGLLLFNLQLFLITMI